MSNILLIKLDPLSCLPTLLQLQLKRIYLNIKFVTTTSKATRELIITKQNNNHLKHEAGIYSIVCNDCHRNTLERPRGI